MARTYWITRESAAKLLGISTRTIDRYIKSWKLSYKKVANKVLLAKEEIASLQEDYGALHQEISTEVVKQTDLTTNYRTKSMYTIPLKMASGTILGVLQIINAQNNHIGNIQDNGLMMVLLMDSFFFK